ncbi:MAG TPA: NADH-quinone oxidoreductase subunit J [Chitinophagaceae bacterium]|jgi:NADH-quinone oxidoreductase subunit J|nr:NADH-quinone oxidoreductase subunit J [Chitinophagaceae bacterium]
MNVIFYIAAIIAIIATALVITGKNAVHALLYLIVSLLAISLIFFLLGAPFIAALEVIVYAGAIMVLFVFVIMMLNLGKAWEKTERSWFSAKAWIGPGILCIILLAELIMVFCSSAIPSGSTGVIGPRRVGVALFGPYVLGVELTAMLLMAGIVGAYHIGREKKRQYHRYLQNDEEKEGGL